MEEKYIILLDKGPSEYRLGIQINDSTDDFNIEFLDFDKDEVSVEKHFRNELKPFPQNKVWRKINKSVYDEITLREKIRVIINNKDGCFYQDGKDTFVWKEESTHQRLPLINCIILEKLDEKYARIKILLNYSDTSVRVNDNSVSTILRKSVIWKGIYSLKPELNIKTYLKSKSSSEEYVIPTDLMKGANEVKVLKDISLYKKTQVFPKQTEHTNVKTQVAIKTETESNIRTNDDRYRIDEMNKLRDKLKSESEKVKKLEEETARCFSQIECLQKEKAGLEIEVRKYSEDKKRFANVIEREEGFNQIIAELKPYQEFYKQYAESKLIEEIKLDFEQVAKFRKNIQQLTKDRGSRQDQGTIDTFGAFTVLNRILIFEVEANDGILDKIAAYDVNFSSSLSEFRNLLRDVNQSIIDSCKNTEDFSLKMIPEQIVIELANPKNYEVIMKFNHSFLDLNIRFNEFTESGWETLSSVLASLQKLVNINRKK